jgi:hypothetical protein
VEGLEQAKANWEAAAPAAKARYELHERFAKREAYRLAVRDGLIPPPWWQSSSQKKPQRKKHAGGRKRDWDQPGIERATKNYIKVHGLPPTAALLIEKVDDACKVAGILFDPQKTQCKEIVRRLIHRLERKRLKREKKSETQFPTKSRKAPPIRNKS